MKYTGHAFRRTSATIMANTGMSVDELKRQIGWKSSTVANGYIEESTVNKLQVSKRIAEVVNRESVASTSSVNAIDVHMIKANKELETAGMQITNNNHCTFNIYLK